MALTIIMHNTVSVDGAVTGFPVDMGRHYGAVAELKPDIYLVGSKTARIGLDMFMPELPEETDADFQKPASDDSRMLWAIPDTNGRLKGKLHVFRDSEYCRDVVIFVSKRTPKAYIKYLEERNYDYHIIGSDWVDLPAALGALEREYSAQRIVTDSGGELNRALLKLGLMDEISMILAPVLAGTSPRKHLFKKLKTSKALTLTVNEDLGDGFLWLRYTIDEPAPEEETDEPTA